MDNMQVMNVHVQYRKLEKNEERPYQGLNQQG